MPSTKISDNKIHTTPIHYSADILRKLKITKQSLSRVLQDLIKHQQPIVTQKKIQNQKSKITSLEDLEDLEELEELSSDKIEGDNSEEQYDNIELNDIFPPKQASLRSGPGSYELNSSFGEKNNDTKITKGIKSKQKTETVKKGKMSVMEQAMAMQKTREKEGFLKRILNNLLKVL